MPGIGELLASTDELRKKSPTDLVANASVLFYLMKKKGLVREDLEGRAIYEPFAYNQGAGYQAINATQEIELPFEETLDAFVYTPKQSLIPVMITEVEKAQNRGAAKILDLLKERGKIAQTTMVNELCTDLNGDGTGRSGKAFAGIKSYIVDSTSAGSVGGVPRSSTSAIRNVAVNLPSTYSGATDESNIEDRILALKNQIWTPDGKYIGYMGSDFYRSGAAALRSRQRLVDKELASAGFDDHLMLEGIPFFLAGGFNPQGGTVIASDRFYIMCADGFKFRTYKGYNMKVLEKDFQPRQLVDVAIRLTIGQFTCNDPARNAVGYDS